MLFLGAAGLSKYALSGLLAAIEPAYLQADVVQVVGEAGKAFPPELSSVLQLAHPSLLMITPAALSPKLRKAGVISTILPATILPAQFTGAPWQVIQTAQMGTMEISSSVSGWNVSPAA
jgi:hypothetical protein